MKRREFMTALGGAAVAWPLAARAQQVARLPTIGFLGASSASARAEWTAAFVQRLRELGWIEGRNIAIEYRWAEGRNERFAEVAAEFVQLKVDVIVTDGGAAVAAKKVTSVTPIVFAVSADPLGTGLVASLARPGGNVTGSTVQAPDLAGKRLGLLREAFPGLQRLAILVNPNYLAAVLEAGETEAAAQKLAIEVVRADIRRVDDIAPAIAGVQGRADGLYVCTELVRKQQSGSHQCIGARGATADDAWFPGVRPGGRSDVLWSKLPGAVPARRRIRRQDPSGRKAGRSAGRAADPI